ncbi:MarR family transcriptional regulator, partial [uncultured Enorma sp.]|uniref:metal-dependent transcriptional regulator n=1 Tax=uncultured Enorma sp. TaxID=1714346 RepID=UPI00280508E8
MLHESGEDYLEAILVIRRLRGSCRNVDIAERLGRSKPSVTKALSNLAAAGLVRKLTDIPKDKLDL